MITITTTISSTQSCVSPVATARQAGSSHSHGDTCLTDLRSRTAPHRSAPHRTAPSHTVPYHTVYNYNSLPNRNVDIICQPLGPAAIATGGRCLMLAVLDLGTRAWAVVYSSGQAVHKTSAGLKTPSQARSVTAGIPPTRAEVIRI
ncbi:hypothetical protein PoB_003956300 [Plakobranchus ocellatus]|uniref:Uncharacterized protein n=1 Tax=Plakobranchus ocellatus TaxID=259542 RepID=A0AAV4B0H3_9GAST|nr:hypothetical protein PoB_003956300 [Plakobranchus ocellatus]